MFHKYHTNNLGFTLVELLIAMAITTVVATGVFSVYKSQSNTNRAQKQVLEMQQNSRMALYMMTNEIRMAGYDYDGSNGGAGALQPLAENIASLEFLYFDEDGAQITPTTPAGFSNIKYIQITIEATTDSNATSSFHVNNRILETTVQCRNIGPE